MLIAHCPADAARRVDLPATFPADERLRALAARRRQLVDARQAEGRRADLASEPIVRESLATVVAALTQSLDAIEEAIERHIASDGELDRLAKALRGVRGVGPVVAATLVADLPEFGRLTENRSQPSSDSPPIRTKAKKRAGRPKPATEDRSWRSALFNAARAAIRHPSPMQDFYNRLVETNHRPGKVALTAVMRKILVIASAVARDPFKATQPQTA